MNILITGGAGFIGSHLTEELVKQGYNVKAFVYYNSFNSWGWLDTLSEEIKDKIEKILHLGDVLITFGDFLENNAQLIPSGYVEEIWIEELKLIISKFETENQYLKQFLIKIPTIEEALKISLDFEFSLHPHYLYFWDKISSEELVQLL